MKSRLSNFVRIVVKSGTLPQFELCPNYAQTARKVPHGTTQNHIGDM